MRDNIDGLNTIRKLVHIEGIEHSYINTSDNGTNATISNNTEYIQIAYKDKQETKFKSIKITDTI